MVGFPKSNHLNDNDGKVMKRLVYDGPNCISSLCHHACSILIICSVSSLHLFVTVHFYKLRWLSEFVLLCTGVWYMLGGLCNHSAVPLQCIQASDECIDILQWCRDGPMWAHIMSFISGVPAASSRHIYRWAVLYI